MYINSLWPCNAWWPRRYESTLVQVMACCLTATSHYLNQCWLAIPSHLYQHEFFWTNRMFFIQLGCLVWTTDLYIRAIHDDVIKWKHFPRYWSALCVGNSAVIGCPQPLHGRLNERDGVSNHQPQDCLLSRLFRHRPKKTSKLRVTGFCAGNSPVTGEFPAQRASNMENVSIWWCHHDFLIT